jgi:hypothetical protein
VPVPLRRHCGSSFADPCSAARELEGRSRRYDGLRSRKPKEVSTRQAHLGTEEIVIGGAHKERCREGNIELYFFSGDRTFASGELIGNCVDAIYHRVGGGETRIQDTSREAERSEPGVESCELIVTRGIGPLHHAAIGRVHGVHRKDVIQLDLDVGDARKRRTSGQQADECGVGNYCRLA